MQHFRLLLSIFLLMTISGQLSGQVNIDEDFNNGLPNDWTTEIVEGHIPWIVFNGQLLFYPSFTSNSWIFTDSIKLTADELYSYSFSYEWLRSGSSSNESLKFTIGTEATSTAQSTILADIPYEGNSDYKTQNGTFVPTTSGTYYLAFQYDGPGPFSGEDISIYNLIFISCARPTNLSIDNHEREATLHWDAGPNGETKWEVIAQPSGGSQPSGAGIPVTSTSYTAAGLWPGTDYEFYVRADCGGGDYSDWVWSGTFTTLCAETISTFSEGFENSGLPNCWENIRSNSVALSTTLSAPVKSGSRAWVLQNNGGSDVGIATQQVSTLGADYRLSFWAFSYSASPGQLHIGTVDFNDNFTLKETISFSAIRTWEQFFIYFSDYAGTDTRLMFKHNNAGFSQSYNIDDVVWEPAPPCYQPHSLNVTNVTSTTATLGWVGGNSDTPIWDIEVGLEGFDPEQGDAFLIRDLSSPSFSAAALSPNTKYSFYARSSCGEGNYSEWTGPFTFTTACGTISSFPFVEDFENMTADQPNCWSIGGTTATASSHFISHSDGFSGEGMRFNSKSNASGNTSELTTPELNLSGLSSAELLFKYKNPTGGNFEILLSFNGGSSFASFQSGFTNQADWQEINLDITNYRSTPLIIKFKGTSNNGIGDAYIYLDDIKIRERNTCLNPSSLTATNITSDAATLSWTENNASSSWEVAVQASGSGAPTSGTSTGANPYTISGLSANTEYEYYVRTNCSGSLSYWSGPYDFTTACGATSSFTQNFDASTVVPDCWFEYGSVLSAINRPTTDMSHSGSVSWELNNNVSNIPVGIICEEVSTLGSNYRLSFWAYSYDSSTKSLHIGTEDDNFQFTQFTTVNINQTYVWEQIIVDFSSYSGSDKRIIIEHGDGAPNQSIFIDDIVWEPIPVGVPNCNAIVTPNNRATRISTKTDISWHPNPEATGYLLQIGTTDGGSDILPATDIGNLTTYDHPNELNFNSTYYIKLTAYNSSGNATGCTSSSFTTDRNPNFGGGSDGSDPNQPTSGGYFFANSTSNAQEAFPSQPSFSWIDPVASGHNEITAWTSGNDDEGYFTIPDLGFDFSYWGSNYRNNNIFISTNGIVTFGGGLSSSSTDFSIPSTYGPETFIAACYMDLDDDTDGKVYYGGNANRFVITWWHYHDYGDASEYITFQLILHSDGRIQVQYNDTESTADELGNNYDLKTILGDALVGIENNDGTQGVEYRNNGAGAPMFSSPLALAFSNTVTSLPVELSFFKGKADDKSNVLFWQTVTESDNSHFDIERSQDGINFSSIGQIQGFGTTPDVHDYIFEDILPLTSGYYRLKQVDFDGGFEYSNTIFIERTALLDIAKLKLYPVPTSDILNTEFYLKESGLVDIQITNNLGMVMLHQSINYKRGLHQLNFDLVDFPNGIYYLSFYHQGYRTTRIITKQE